MKVEIKIETEEEKRMVLEMFSAKKTEPKQVQRFRKANKRWTKSEDKRLLEMVDQDLSNREISEELGRTVGAIWNRKFVLLSKAKGSLPVAMGGATLVFDN